MILEAEECENVIVKGDCCRFSLRLADEEGRPLRFFGGGTDPVSLKALAPHVTVKKIMPQTPVWSGCSWGLYEIQRRLLHGSQEENILLSLTNNSKRRLCVRTQAFLSRACEADSTVKVKFYSPEEVEDSLLKFAVIVSRCGEQWVFCRHKERSSYECPGGHREERETLEETARRELYEETGAKAYELKEICVYSVIHSDPKTGEESESFGMLFGARIQSLGALPRDFEMAEVKLTKALPEEWTYPQIQPFLLKKAWEEYFM